MKVAFSQSVNKEQGVRSSRITIIESQNHRLEKMSKITKSNHPPNTTMPTKPYPEVPHLHVFINLQGWRLHQLLGQPVPMPDHSFCEEIFPNI